MSWNYKKLILSPLKFLIVFCFFFASLKGEDRESTPRFAVGKCQICFEGLTDQEGIKALKKATLAEGLTSKGRGRQVKIADLKLQQQKERWINTLLYLGYLDAKLSVKIDDSKALVQLKVKIRPGALYHLNELEVLINEGALPTHLRPLLPPLPCPAKTSLIQKSLGKILADFQTRGYPFVKIESQIFDVIGTSADLKGRVLISTGPFCLFGNCKVTGNKGVLQQFIDKRLRFSPNEPFNINQVDESRKNLEASGLFNAATIELQRRNSSKLGPHFVDLNINLAEAKSRSLGIGLSRTISHNLDFDKDRELGIRVEWSHRNLRGLGENLALNSFLSKGGSNTTLQYSQQVETTRSDIAAQLRVAASFVQDKARGFDATSWSTGIYLDHQFQSAFSFSKGIKIEQIATHGELQFPKTSLLAFPLSLTWSTTSDLLDPHQGSKCSLLFTPVLNLNSERKLFTKQEIFLAHYFDFNKVTLAISAQVANFWGIECGDVPPSLRYFLGSSNFMRGYSYKSISPLDARGKPKGGGSSITLAVEPRIRLHPQFTLVPFLEWGQVYSKNWPKKKNPFLRSTGLGVYVNSPIGPLRFDCAIPLNRRKDIDKKVEFYMSLGSAF